MNIKYFLNLPKTNFPMKANLVINELNILKKWNNINLYTYLKNKYKNDKYFIIHDGPPYANGKIHLGHALNKILKDIIIKFKSFNKYNVIFIPGWDCHGLPIELKIESNIVNIVNDKHFRTKCEKYALSQIKKQEKDFIRLGILADWKNKYLTMDYNIQANTIKILAKLIKLKYLYRDFTPVYWCTKCTSSLSESEIEYYFKKTISAYILFLIDKTSIINKKILSLLINKNCFLVIWTTTIWTLPANKAISINPLLNYLIILCNNKFNLIIEKNLFQKKIAYFKNIKTYKILMCLKGLQLKYIKYFNLFNNIKLSLIFDNNINNIEGTGLVHIAPDHGKEDYELCKKYNINTINIIDKYGNYIFDNYLPKFLQGKNINNIKLIINYINKKKYLLNTVIINHKYPYCWRHKYPIIFRSTAQWFINMNFKNLKNKCLNNINKINWIPTWGKNRMKEMLSIRPDWCISRQRLWGIPLPLFINKQNFNIHPNMNCILLDIIKKIKIYGINYWWNVKKKQYLNEKDINLYDKVIDTIDVWFDSGSTFYTVLKNKNIDLFLEGSDQYRGWFMSSIILSTIINNINPTKTIVSHGFIVDKNKKKMSKSLNNTLSPNKIIKKFGADILRLWVANNDFTHEISISNKKLISITIIYRKIRNTIRYILSNLYDFDINNFKFKIENLLFIDKWIIHKCIHLNQKINILYKNYKFHKIIKKINIFCSIILGTFYLDIVKDRLYTMAPNSLGRKSCQISLWYILNFLIRWIAPILSFTAEEIWNYIVSYNINKTKYPIKSIFYNKWLNISLKSLNINFKFYKKWKILLEIKKHFNKLIESFKKKEQIITSLQIKVIIFLPNKVINNLKKLIIELPFLLLSNKIILIDNNFLEKKYINNKYYFYINKNMSFILKKTLYPKCIRCWHYKLSTSIKNQYGGLYICTRCLINLNSIFKFNNYNGEKRFYF